VAVWTVVPSAWSFCGWWVGDKKFMLRDVVAGELEICGEGRAPCSLPVARFGVRLSGPANGLAADDERGSVPSLQD